MPRRTSYSVTLPFDGTPPELLLFVKVLDVMGSFVALPFAVVCGSCRFLRGTWLLLDSYFRGVTLEVRDMNCSEL